MTDYPPSGVILRNDSNWTWQGKWSLYPRQKPVADLNEAIDQSVKDGGFWERGTFTVPIATTEERVQLLAYKYIRKFGDFLEEKKGYRVHKVVGPVLDDGLFPIPADRRKYVLFAFVSKRPIIPIFDIPDQYVPEMQKAGLRLLE